MKTIKLLLLGVFLTTSFIQCAKDGKDGTNGKDGSNGTTGANGANGQNGNANVKLYVFDGTYNFTSLNEKTTTINCARDTSERSLWITYMLNAPLEEFQYALPGYGTAGNTFYRVYSKIEDTSINIYITKVTGPGETYNRIKIYRIYANNIAENGVADYNGFSRDQVEKMSIQELEQNFVIN